MHIYNTIKNFLYDKNYYIAQYDNKIYCCNIKKIIFLSKEKVTLKLENKKIDINGDNLIVEKLTKEEILITGNIKDVRRYE